MSPDRLLGKYLLPRRLTRFGGAGRRLPALVLMCACLVSACSGSGDPQAAAAPTPSVASPAGAADIPAAPPAASSTPTLGSARDPAVVFMRARFSPEVTFRS